jgi:raffinose/stachyose/melibiose transport system substrate-binding protein
MLLALVIAAAVLVAATAPSFGAAQRKSAPIEITFVDRVTSPTHDKFVKYLVDTFNQRNDGKIHVTYSGIPVNSYVAKIPLVLKSSKSPDVFFSYEAGFAKYIVDSGWSAPLDKYWTKYGWTKELTPAASDVATIEGHKYFLPYYMAASVLWYNTDLFKKNGLQPPKTYEQMTADAAKLKAAGVAPYMLANQQQWEAQFPFSAYFANRYGLATYKGLIDRKIPWTDPRVVDALNAMAKDVKDGQYLQPINGMDFDTTAIIFWKRQQAAMWYQGSFILSKFLDKGKLAYPVDWVPYPKIGGTKPSVSVYAESTYMLNKNSKNKDAAAAFLDFVVSKEAQTKMLELDGPFAANRSVRPPASSPPLVRKLAELIASYDKPTFTHPDHALSPDVAVPFLRELQSVLAGRQSAAKAAAITEAAAKRAQGPVKG